MSKVIKQLMDSEDPLYRDLGKALREWQVAKRANGRPGTLGYEPREINRLGPVEVISRRVRKQSSGFWEVPREYSYEAIVCRYSDRFEPDVVQIAEVRLKDPNFSIP
jgi:hypothetical protein